MQLVRRVPSFQVNKCSGGGCAPHAGHCGGGRRTTVGNAISDHRGPQHPVRATTLAIQTDHHLFDSLYHAVALEHGEAVLITAYDRYRRKAERYGKIVALAEWENVT